MSLEKSTFAFAVIIRFLTLKEILGLLAVSKDLFSPNCLMQSLDIFYFVKKIRQLEGLNKLPSQLSNAKLHLTVNNEIMLKNLPSNTVSLNFRHCHLGGEGLKKLPHALRVLNLENCIRIYSKNFLEFLPPLLQSFTLAGELKNNDLTHIPKNLKYLHIISEIDEFKYFGTSLEVLKIKSTRLRNLSNLPRSLIKLDISSCSNIALESLLNLPPGLKKLNISDCNITEEDITWISNDITIVCHSNFTLPPPLP